MEYSDPHAHRAYFFGNMYISPIQHGIQAAHVVTKMFARYGRDHESPAADVLYDWADVGVTKILLNGGYQSNLADVHSIFEIVCPRLGIPYAKFHEEEAALNGALTSVGVVVPVEIYEIPEISLFDWTQPTVEFPDAGAYLHGCTTPKDILEVLLEMRNMFAHPCLEEDFFRVALYLTLKSARLA
jgi:hypothetical protein